MQIDSYFTQQIDVKSIILEHLDIAESTVFIVLAWFKDKKLFRKFLDQPSKAVYILEIYIFQSFTIAIKIFK